MIPDDTTDAERAFNGTLGAVDAMLCRLLEEVRSGMGVKAGEATWKDARRALSLATDMSGTCERVFREGYYSDDEIPL